MVFACLNVMSLAFIPEISLKAGFLGGLGPLELGLILLVVLVIFGPKNLPKLGKSLGETVKSVREGMESEEPEQLEGERANTADDLDMDIDVSDEVSSAAAVAEDVQTDGVFCTSCGTKNPADAAFCSKCGSELSARS